MRSTILLATVVALSFMVTACQQQVKKDADGETTMTADTVSVTTAAADTAMADMAHSSMNSLDWAGTYKGVVPCADCEGIETALTLGKDMNYSISTVYLGKDKKAHTHTGTFSWNQQGNTVILGGLQNAPTQYFVGENTLVQLDLQGNRITGELASKYILTKE